MGRRKKNVRQFEAWCWYCDREFEDEKVLLQHQRAKHYRCTYCPRRLNTSGGLTVHLHQVHKAEPTIIENALPGRESFDIEIYGMVGIPEADLREWQERKAKRGENGTNGRFSNGDGIQRPKIDKGVISQEQLRIQLEAHKALMSGKAPPPGTAQALFGFAPPNAIGFPPNVPPPGFNPSIPPPSLTSQRPPPFGIPPPSHGPGIPPYSGPPPGFPQPPRTNLPPHIQPGQYQPMSDTMPSINAHEEAVKQGAKSRVVYSDTNLSPEEKLASTSRYAYVDPEDQKVTQPQPNFSVPPPNMVKSELNPAYSVPPPSFGSAHSRSGPPSAQSYPAVQADTIPPSANPQNNTAEALAALNEEISNPVHGVKREADMELMQSQANSKRARPSDEAIESDQTNTPPSRPGRAKAADLF